MKVLAMYLPQFHRVKENDEWWGEGFTEWVAVKNAEPLFEGHLLPRVPLNRYYYDLMDKKTMMHQAELMHRYDIDGFVFYHYYFANGRKILEKPAENLLSWKEIDMPFCFSWANETWARSWSKISGKNVWFDDGNRAKLDDDNEGILLKQEYGSKQDWIDHFNYLKEFFIDDRYIKIDNKPLFIIHRTEEIGCIVEMLSTWREMARQIGFDGIYILSTNRYSEVCDGELLQEPIYTMLLYYQEVYKSAEHGLARKIEYDDIYSKSIAIHRNLKSFNQFSGVFPSFDDTPRRGRGGTAIVNSTPKKFSDYIGRIMELSANRGSNIVFINAWNEWGETMYLEPDEVFGYKYLEAVSIAKRKLSRYIPSCEEKDGLDEDIIQKYEKKIEQYRSYWTILNKLLMLKEKNESIGEVIIKKGWDNIGIYGVGMLGMHLINEMNDYRIPIKYAIDGKGKQLKMDFPIYTLDEDFPEANVIIVTVCYDYGSIKKILEKKTNCEIVSLADIVDAALEYRI